MIALIDRIYLLTLLAQGPTEFHLCGCLCSPIRWCSGIQVLLNQLELENGLRGHNSSEWGF